MREWEEKSCRARQEDRVADGNELQRRGMKFIEHAPDAAAACPKLSEDPARARMHERIDGAGAGAEM